MAKVRFTMEENLLLELAEKQYSCHHVETLVRELLQNGRDAQQRNGNQDAQIEVTILRKGAHTSVVCLDQGCGMTIAQIGNDFLHTGGHAGEYSVGNSQTGGFGIAKLTICVRSIDWSVHTLTNLFTKQMGQDGTDIIESAKHINGTRVYAKTMAADNDTINRAMAYALLSDANVQVTANHIKFKSDTTEFVEVKKQGVLTVSQRQIPAKHQALWPNGITAVRANGLVQFLYRTVVPGLETIVDVEINCRPKEDGYPFPLSRESLNDGLDGTLYWLLDAMKVDKSTTHSRLEEKQAQKVKRYADVYRAAKTFQPEFENLETMDDITRQEYILDKIATAQAECRLNDKVIPDMFGELSEDQLVDKLIEMIVNGSLSLEQAIKQDEGRIETDNVVAYKTATYARHADEDIPSTIFEQNLLELWARILAFVENEPFKIGLTGGSELAARASIGMCQESVYLINPWQFVKYTCTIKTKIGLLLLLLEIAVHEVTHCEYSQHDESFTSAMSAHYSHDADFYAGLLTDRKSLGLAQTVLALAESQRE